MKQNRNVSPCVFEILKFGFREGTSLFYHVGDAWQILVSFSSDTIVNDTNTRLPACYTMGMESVLLPETLCAAPFAPLLLDKVVKRVRAELGDVSMEIVIPQHLPDTTRALKLMAEAARNGLLCRRGTVPEGTDAFHFRLGSRDFSLRLPSGLCDGHAHTQFAYCGRGIDVQDAATLSLALGTERQSFTEHAFALYFPSNALKFHWQSDPAFVEHVWATPERGRMVAYRELIAELRGALGERVRFGLEVDLFGGGRLCLAPEDVGGWDYLIGAVHEVEGIDPTTATDAELECAWLRDVERLLTCPISVLAHPFRYFPWAHRTVPRHLYRPVAKMLAQAGVAAEINHHKNPFELDFFRACLEEGVRLSLGTDAHVTRDIADFLPHLATLHDLGLRPEDSATWMP